MHKICKLSHFYIFSVLALALPLCADAATVYLRPTADAFPASAITTIGCSTGARDGNYPMGGMYSGAYSGKSQTSPVPPTGSSASATVAESDNPGQEFDQDVFGGASFTWQSKPVGTLLGATLNISIAKTVSGSSNAFAYYTTNSGSTWTSLGTIGASQTTLTASGITSMTGLGVAVCGQTGTVTGAATVTVYDVWVAWTYTTGSPKKTYAFVM